MRVQTFFITSVPNAYGAGAIYQVDGVNKPVLNLIRGGIYTFDQSSSSNTNHQIAFKDGAGASFVTGVVRTGTPGTAGAQTVFTVPADAPNDLRYYCVAHGNAMGNAALVITDVNDAAPAALVLAAAGVTVDEGAAAIFVLSTTNFQSGTVVPYSLSGVSAADIVGGALSGTVTVGTNGQATISVPIAADNLTEGPETLTVSVQGSSGAPGVSASVLINDTSTTPVSTGRVDTKAFSVSVAQASVRSNDGGTTWTVTTPAGAETLTTYVRLQFLDKHVGLDIAGNAGQAYRIYKAAFDRVPDQGGLGYWINDLDKGASIKDVAGGFMASAEFKGLYGANPSDQAFISLLYDNVLGRKLDTPGFEYWMQDIARGETRASLLVNFSESKENQDNVVELIGNGVVFTPWVG